VTDPASVSHNRAFELLPWLVNGTLTGLERDGVEQHVRACIACRRELKQQQQLHAVMRARRTADVSAEAGFDRLDRELDGLNKLGERRWPLKYATAAPFAVAAAAGLAVLAVLVWFTPLPDLGANGYQTLATAPGAETPQLDIVFAADTTAAEMPQLLDEIDGEIVAGPSTLGRYSVRISGAELTAAQLAKLLEPLGADPRVRFAGRALMEVEP